MSSSRSATSLGYWNTMAVLLMEMTSAALVLLSAATCRAAGAQTILRVARPDVSAAGLSQAADQSSTPSFTDPRGGTAHMWTPTGGQVWMGETVKYRPEAGSLCWNDDEAEYASRGRVAAPTAKQVIDRYVEVIGGREALDAIRTIRTERVLTHLEEGRIIEETIYRKRPHLYRAETKHGSSSIVNGNHAWRGDLDSTGVIHWSAVDPPRGTDFEARLGWFIDYEAKGYDVVFVGTEVIDGVPMHHLQMTWPDGVTRELFFGVATGLFVMFKPTTWGTVRLHDFRRVGGILFPHVTEARGISPTGQEVHHLNMIVSLEVNLPMSDSLFVPAPPPEGG